MKKLTGLAPAEPQVVSLLEAAYRVDRHELDWVEGVREAFAPSAPGAVLVQAFVYDASDEQRLRLRVVRGGTEEQQQWMQATGPGSQAMGAFVRRAFEGQSSTRISSEVQSHEGHAQLLEQVFANDWGIVDGWGVLGGDLQRRGLAVGALSSCLVAPLSPQLAAMWQGVAAHLSAAFCLREAMAAGKAPAESVLSPDGTLLHAEGDARSLAAREALVRAVGAIDRARRRYRRHSPEALAAWQAVVAGRWTLVDQTESDGKRVLLARVNELPTRAGKQLSGREAQALGLAAQGLSNKQIGYRLGVGAPAVTNYLKRAAQKLGVSSRAGLLRWAQLSGAPGREKGVARSSHDTPGSSEEPRE